MKKFFKKYGFFVSGILLSVFLLSPVLFSQDYPKVAPKTVPKKEIKAKLPVRPIEHPLEGKKILVSRLNALVFVSNMGGVRVRGISGEKGIVIDGLDILDNKIFALEMADYIGEPVTMDSLNEIVRKVIVFYRERSRPIVDVIVPEQEITTGVIQIVVIEGRFGEIDVQGNKWFKSEFLASQVRMKTGGQFDSVRLLEDLNWLNSNPFREVDFIYTPGKEVGTTDLILRTTDRIPIRVFSGYEDTGTVSTDRNRMLAGVNWGDAFGTDSQFNYQFTTDPDFKNLRAHSGNVLIPLPWRHTLSLFGTYVKAKGIVPTSFSMKGESWQISGRYGFPFPKLFEYYQHEAGLGFDFKQSDNNLEFGGSTVTNATTHVVQWSGTYDAAFKYKEGRTSFGGAVYYSPGDVTSRNEDRFFTQVRSFAKADYLYGTAHVEQLFRLPWDFSVFSRFRYQFAEESLLPSEQFGLGGYNTVRGYDERESNGDRGYLFSTELRTPPISFGEMLKLAWLKDNLQILGFWDYGVTENRKLLSGEDPHEILSSIGPGVRYVISPCFTLRFDYGFTFYKTAAFLHRSRPHFGLILSF